MSTYNGHKNYNYWNVALWIGNDEGLYHLAKDCIRSARTREDAARNFVASLSDTHTPDGAPWSQSAVRAAMVGL